MRIIALISLMCLAPVPALAEPLQVQLKLDATPAFAQDDALDLDEDIVDEGEYVATLEVSKKNIWHSQGIALAMGVSSAPQKFDDQAPTSARFYEIRVGGDAIRSLHKLTLAETNDLADAAVNDQWRPYAKFRHSVFYDGFFDSRARQGQDLTVGLRFVDVRTIMCDHAARPASTVGACSNTPGVSWDVRAEAMHGWSSDDARELTQYTLRADLIGRTVARAVRFGVRLRADRSHFDHVLVGTEKRKEWRVRAGVGANFTPLVSRLHKDLTLDFELRRQWRDSNDPARDKDDFHFLAATGFTVKF